MTQSKAPTKPILLSARKTLPVLLAIAIWAPVSLGAAPARPAAHKPEVPPAPTAGQSTEALTLNDNADDGVAAVVNDSIISDYDLRQRVALFLATSGIRATAENIKNIRRQVLTQLETERLEILEAQRKKISVSTSEVDRAIDNILRDNHLTAEQIKRLLAGANVEMATFRSQIAAQLAWTKT